MGGRVAGRANAAGAAWGGGLTLRGPRGGRANGRAVDVLTCSQEAAYIYMQPNGCM